MYRPPSISTLTAALSASRIKRRSLLYRPRFDNRPTPAAQPHVSYSNPERTTAPKSPTDLTTERTLMQHEIARLEGLLKETTEQRWMRVAREQEEKRKAIEHAVEELEKEKLAWERMWTERYHWGA